MMKAKLVIRIGRRRRRQASSTALTRSMPSSCFSLANSTMRMAFLQANPTSTIKPIWVKMLLSPPARITPVIADNKVIGTIRITASGRLQAELLLGLHVNLISTAKTVEVVGVQRAQVYLHGVEDVADRHAVGLGLFAVDGGIAREKAK